MEKYAIGGGFAEIDSAPGQDLNKYYSVEIPIDGLGVIYQFKIWEIESMFMSILVKENSRILPWIKVGCRLNMRYYSTDPVLPYQKFNTEIRYIKRQEHGRLIGHYLVGLEIVESLGRTDIRWPYHSDGAQILRFQDALINDRRA